MASPGRTVRFLHSFSAARRNLAVSIPSNSLDFANERLAKLSGTASKQLIISGLS
jgi:hypothetical protein